MSHKKSTRRARVKRAPATKTAGSSAVESMGLSIAGGDIARQLGEGIQLLRQSREEELPALLEPLSHELPASSDEHRSLYRRLLAFGYANTGKLLKAEELCREELRTSDRCIDAHFLLTFIYLSMREYDRAVEHGRRYNELAATNAGAAIAVGENYRAQVLNFIGSACYEQENYDEAADWFNDSIKHDPAYHLPYLNLANAAMRRHRKDEAREIVERGLRKCRQVQDLKLLKETIGKTATISACLMVKNEEELLPGCLDSIRDWVDEIIVVDTGSTDRTIEIAESYGARVYHQPWEGNFSKHRNYTIELATCEWVFIIDADERFVKKDVPGLLSAINSGDHEVISVNVYNLYGRSQHKLTSVNSIRFFRRKLNLRYEGIVHNSLYVPKGIRIARAPFAIEHLGYDLEPEKMEAKFERSHALLLKQVEEDPDFAYAWFNLAQLYRGRFKDDLEKFGPRVIECAQKVIELIDPEDAQRGHFYIMAHDQIGWSRFLLGDYDEAERWARKALELKPDYLDPMMLLGHVHSRRGEAEEAIAAYRRYLEARDKYNADLEIDAMILYHPENQVTAYFGMACMAEMIGRMDDARRYYRCTLDYDRDHLDAQLHLGRIYLQEGNLKEAETLFRKAVDGPYRSARAALGLGTVSAQLGCPDEAEKWYEQALSLEPDSHDILIEAGKFFLGAGQIERAHDLLERAASSENATPETFRHLASLCFSRGDFERAITLYNRVVAADSADTQAHNDLGNCHFRKEDFDKAEAHYLVALQSDEAMSVTWRNLGLARARMDRPQDALAAFDKYMELAPGDVQILPLIGDLHCRLGEFQAAIPYYEKFLARHPHSASVLFGLAECYLNMGHTDSAILGYRRVLTLEPANRAAQKRLAELFGSAARA